MALFGFWGPGGAQDRLRPACATEASAGHVRDAFLASLGDCSGPGARRAHCRRGRFSGFWADPGSQSRVGSGIRTGLQRAGVLCGRQRQGQLSRATSGQGSWERVGSGDPVLFCTMWKPRPQLPRRPRHPAPCTCGRAPPWGPSWHPRSWRQGGLFGSEPSLSLRRFLPCGGADSPRRGAGVKPTLGRRKLERLSSVFLSAGFCEASSGEPVALGDAPALRLHAPRPPRRASSRGAARRRAAARQAFCSPSAASLRSGLHPGGRGGDPTHCLAKAPARGIRAFIKYSICAVCPRSHRPEIKRASSLDGTQTAKTYQQLSDLPSARHLEWVIIPTLFSVVHKLITRI